uniref:Uncharacterized protein n=1 Tax=Cacopsylla melanoneura TaxID=428564 RepID=A0A8D8YQ87_9HEMI
MGLVPPQYVCIVTEATILMSAIAIVQWTLGKKSWAIAVLFACYLDICQVTVDSNIDVGIVRGLMYIIALCVPRSVLVVVKTILSTELTRSCLIVIVENVEIVLNPVLVIVSHA